MHRRAAGIGQVWGRKAMKEPRVKYQCPTNEFQVFSASIIAARPPQTLQSEKRDCDRNSKKWKPPEELEKNTWPTF
jgi:hypothetical protein